MRSDTVFGPLSAKRSLIGVLLGSATSIARFRLRQRRAQILGEGLNCSEFEMAAVELRGPVVAVWFLSSTSRLRRSFRVQISDRLLALADEMIG